MKKTRNSFFAESSYQAYNPMQGGIPQTNQMNPPVTPGPYQSSSNYFYQGPMPNNYTTNESDIESRFAKIERQLNRMDYRITKLESAGNVVSSDDVEINNSNMYML